EGEERDRRRRLEERRLLTADRRPEPARRFDKGYFRERTTVDLDALAEGAEVRGCVESRAPARCDEDRCDGRGDRSLPVRPADVDRVETAVRISDGREQPRRLFRTPADPARQPGKELTDEFRIGERVQSAACSRASEATPADAASGRPSMWRSSRPTVAFSSRRST